MKTALNRTQTWLMVLLLAVFTTGCATPVFWGVTAPRKWQPTHLDQILYVTNANHQSDVVILFSQTGFKQQYNIKTRDVGWLISRPTNGLAVTAGAIRQITNSCSSLQVVPCYDSGNVPACATTKPPGYGVYKLSVNQLTLHINGIPPGPYTLPSNTNTYTTWRIIGMPVAVATDVAILTVIAVGEGCQGMH